MSCEKGVPITAHQGFSRKRSFRQQAPHRAPGCETCRGSRHRPAGTAVFPAVRVRASARLLRCGHPAHAPCGRDHRIAEPQRRRHFSPPQDRDRTGPSHFAADHRHGPSGRAQAPRPPACRPGRRLSHGRVPRTISPSGWRRRAEFPKAAALFCVTPARTGRGARLRQGGRDVRVEADAAFLGGEAASLRRRARSTRPASIDLAVSLLSLQDENDIPGMLIQIRRALKPDGLFLGALAGAGTLAELRESLLAAESGDAWRRQPRVMPFADVRDAGALLQRAGFALPVADVETVTVRYATLFDLMADLRAMGAANALSARSRRPATRQFFRARGRNLCRTIFRSRRTHQGDLLVRLAVGMGAGRLAAEAVEARLGRGFAGEDAGGRKSELPLL